MLLSILNQMTKSQKTEPNLAKELVKFILIISLGVVIGVTTVMIFKEQITNFLLPS